MAKRVGPCEAFLTHHHVAVRLEDTILVLMDFNPKINKRFFGEHDIWIYNLWTEQWKAHTIQPETRVKGLVTRSKLGVAIASDVYILAGYSSCPLGNTSVLWKLARCNDGSFASTTSSLSCSQFTRRTAHCDWEHGKKLWIFGGCELSQRKLSNELFCCDPSVQTFSRVICSGTIPSPRENASAAVIKDKVWLCGGNKEVDGCKFDLHELDMLSFLWTKIETGMPRPWVGNLNGTLTPIQDSQLVLHGGRFKNTRATWIFDVELYTWRTHQNMYHWNHHAGFTGLCGDVIILGGYHHPSDTVYKQVENVRLWPKSLQQLAMRIVYGNRTDLPWKSLPPKLIGKMMATEPDETY